MVRAIEGQIHVAKPEADVHERPTDVFSLVL